MENNKENEININKYEKVESLGNIKEEDQIKKEEQIQELKMGEFKEIMDPIKSAFEEELAREEFMKSEIYNSLVLAGETKNTLLENLKKSWNDQHLRVQDFKYKKILKYPQIFYFTMFTYHDPEYESFDQKTSTITKYTFNLDDNIEADVGGSIMSRNSVGSGNMFLGLRFNMFKDKVFNYLSYTGGDFRKFFYEINYLSSNNLLFDYMYKRKLDDDDIPIQFNIGQADYHPDLLIKNEKHPNFKNFKHSFMVHKMLTNKKNRMAAGFVIDNKNLSIKLQQKFVFNKKDSVKTSLTFNSVSYKCKNKVKNKFSKNVYFESEQISDFFGNSMNTYRHKIFYKIFSLDFFLGIFSSFDGVGIDMGFKYGGVHLNFPFLMYLYNPFEEDNQNVYQSIGEYLFAGIFSASLGYLIRIARLGISKLRFGKSIIKEPNISEKMELIKIKKIENLKIKEALIRTSEKFHQIELDKKEKGLIVHLALYGKFKDLETYKKDFDYLANKIKYGNYNNINRNTDDIEMKIKELKIENFDEDVDYEIINVTYAVRNKISSNPLNTYSSILFSEPTKTNIFGFYNPIYKSDEIPFILIIYEIQGILKVVFKSDSEIFQIPDEILRM